MRIIVGHNNRGATVLFQDDEYAVLGSARIDGRDREVAGERWGRSRINTWCRKLSCLLPVVAQKIIAMRDKRLFLFVVGLRGLSALFPR